MTYLSYSQINMYLDCGRRWQGHYRQDLKGPVGEALTFGSVAHSVIEKFVADKTIDPLAAWGEAWVAMLASDMGKSTVWDETPEVAFETGVRIFSSNDVIDTLATIDPLILHKKIEPTMTDEEKIAAAKGYPAIEQEIHWKLEDMPDIIGYIDCIQDDGVPVDFKTAGKMWASDKASKEIQPLFYLAAMKQLGMTAHAMRFRHVVVTKAKTPRIEIFEEQRSESELEFMELVVRRVWMGISSGVFLPNPMSWLCDPTRCGAWAVCAGKGR